MKKTVSYFVQTCGQWVLQSRCNLITVSNYHENITILTLRDVMLLLYYYLLFYSILSILPDDRVLCLGRNLCMPLIGKTMCGCQHAHNRSTCIWGTNHRTPNFLQQQWHPWVLISLWQTEPKRAEQQCQWLNGLLLYATQILLTITKENKTLP